MESFFLAETIKYLYLIFDEEHFLHANGESATEHRTPDGVCYLDTGFIYNTEAHPIDIGALDCCRSSTKKEEFTQKNRLVKSRRDEDAEENLAVF